ncbi:MAG: hypothetical protein KGL48_06840 [Sphingomonadales bacterium]|nr:hypothetical protein [Sphingomonadales bacterium]MDE2569945.1 hypothetical protein [Sphingomonadales bacterium]
MPAPVLAQGAPKPAPAPAPDLSRLTSGHRAALQCAAVFAVVALEQKRGLPSALAFPPLAWRGKEFFVRASAQVEDEAGLNREQVRDLLVADVAALQRQAADSKDPDGTLAAAMKPCQAMLDASVAPLEKPDLLACAAIFRLAYEEVHASEGMTARAKDLMTLGSVLEDRARKQQIAAGKSGNEADAALERARDALRQDPAGADRYALETCDDLARPDPKTHY